MDTFTAEVIIGLDVGKTGHHGCALTAAGKKIYDKELPQDETKLRELFDTLKSEGEVLMVVDQPNTIGALPVAVARDCDVAVAYLPGLAMRKAADLYPGTAKTDKRDAYIIADVARTMPHTLRVVDRNDETLAALKMLAGLDEDLARDCTRIRNRLRGLLTQIHPALERVFNRQDLAKQIVLDLLIHYGGPTALAKSGKARVSRWAMARTRKSPQRLIDEIFQALGEQSVVVPGTAAAEIAIKQQAENLKTLLSQRRTVAGQVEEMLDAFPLAEVLMSMPGVGIKTTANILLTVGDCSDFPDAAHLASYAGIAPVTRRSGSSIRGEFPARAGNKRLKNALFYSAWVASNHHAASKEYYAKKRSEGKRHNAAVMCLARRRCNVIYAMLTRGEFFREPDVQQVPMAA